MDTEQLVRLFGGLVAQRAFILKAGAERLARTQENLIALDTSESFTGIKGRVDDYIDGLRKARRSAPNPSTMAAANGAKVALHGSEGHGMGLMLGDGFHSIVMASAELAKRDGMMGNATARFVKRIVQNTLGTVITAGLYEAGVNLDDDAEVEEALKAFFSEPE